MNAFEGSMRRQAVLRQLPPNLEMVARMWVLGLTEVIVAKNPAVTRRVLLILKTGGTRFQPPPLGYLFEV
jgi:hypothetical protein